MSASEFEGRGLTPLKDSSTLSEQRKNATFIDFLRPVLNPENAI